MKGITDDKIVQVQGLPGSIDNIPNGQDNDSDRFARTRLLIGANGVERLASACVAVFGLGGVGSYTVEALARAGVGNLILVDYDRIVASNINRQLHALETTIGRYKTEVMAERVRLINPDCQVTTITERYRPGRAEFFLQPKIRIIVDAIDDLKAKVDLIKEALRRNITIFSAMGAGNKLNPAAFRLADISETSVCPFARRVRRELRRAGIASGVRVVFSTEPPHRRPGKKGPCGTISFVPATAGLLLAAAVIESLLSEMEK